MVKKVQVLGALTCIMFAAACAKSGDGGGGNPPSKEKPAAKPGPSQDSSKSNPGGIPTPGSGATPGTGSTPTGTDPVDGSTCPESVIADYQTVMQACGAISSPDDMPRCQDAQSAFHAKHPNVKCEYTDSGTHVKICSSTNNPNLCRN